MQAPSGQPPVPALQALLQDGALAGEWVLDPRTSNIRLKSKVMGLVRVHGVFRQVSGNGTIFPDGEVSSTLTVAAASIDTNDTNDTRRDTHLRSADLFDSGNYPDITFTADGVRPSCQGVVVTGALTVRGRTRPLSFDAAASVRGDARSGSTPRSTSTGPTSASPGIRWAGPRCTTPSQSTPPSPGGERMGLQARAQPLRRSRERALGGPPAVQTPQHRDEGRGTR